MAEHDIMLYLEDLFEEAHQLLDLKKVSKAFVGYSENLDRLSEVVGQDTKQMDEARRIVFARILASMERMMSEADFENALLAANKLQNLNKAKGNRKDEVYVELQVLQALCFKQAGRLNDALETLLNAEKVCKERNLHCGKVLINISRVYALLKKLKQAEQYSRMAVIQFTSDNFELERLKGESAEQVDELQAQRQEVYRNLAVAFYLNASHHCKLEDQLQALESIKSAEKYQGMVPGGKESPFNGVIEKKTEEVRSKLNTEQDVRDNKRLIQARAQEARGQERGQDSKLVSIHKERLNSRHGESTVTKSRPSTAFTANSNLDSAKMISSETSSKVKKDLLSKIHRKPIGRLHKVVKNPKEQQMLDSLQFRTSTWYLHNEYYFKELDKGGVNMYKSDSNNSRFYPYADMNPIPNDKEYRLTRTKANRVKGHSAQLNFKQNQYHEVLGDSFDSNPSQIEDIVSSDEERQSHQNQRPATKAENNLPRESEGQSDEERIYRDYEQDKFDSEF